jgi:hypothetical protein
MSAIAKGHVHWLIADGYIPPVSSGDLESHESICVLNCYEQDAELTMTVYFEDRPPLENIKAVVPGRRTKHLRTSLLRAGDEAIPVGVPYALEVVSTVPVVVQYSRLDATQPANALMTAIGYPVI